MCAFSHGVEWSVPQLNVLNRLGLQYTIGKYLYAADVTASRRIFNNGVSTSSPRGPCQIL